MISGNGRAGVQILSNTASPADSNIIAGNFIGTNKAGTAAIPNVYSGVWLNGSSASALVRSNVVNANVVSGNTGNGIELRAVPATSLNAITGNHVGTDVLNTLSVANGANGISVVGSNNTISSNVIAHNGGSGVVVGSFAGNRITSNSISAN